MDFEQYGKYMQENIQMLSARDYISDLEKTMKEFREMKNLIRISKINADEKRDSITNIGRLEQQLTQNIKTLKKQLAAQQ
jgi:predicted  nucleic acid-binding Zn-ribbon protein